MFNTPGSRAGRKRISTGTGTTVDPAGALDSSPLAVRVDGVTIDINGSNELEVIGSTTTVSVDASGALDGDGSGGSPLAIRVDGSTIQVNGSNELEVIGTTGSGTTDTVVLKAADESVTSSTVLQNDDELLFAVGTSETWIFRLLVLYTAATAGDIKLALTAPSGSTISWVSSGLSSGTAGNSDNWASNFSAVSGTASGSHGGAGATEVALHVHGTITTASTAGNVVFQWAQNTSSGTATIVKAGSQLIATNTTFIAATRNTTFGIVIDGSGSVITTGVKGFIRIPVACTITKATLLSIDSVATAGSIVVDIWKDTYANYPPTVADTITASAKPTLSAAAKSEDSTLTGWTTSVSAGDVIGFKVDSSTTVTKVLVQLDAITTS